MATEIKHMSSGIPFPGGTTRGLECRTREGSNRRRFNKITSINAVLDEQDLQFKREKCDPNALRRVYLVHSQRCQTESQLLAKGDESEARMFLKDSDQGCYYRKLFAQKRAVMREIRGYRNRRCCDDML